MNPQHPVYIVSKGRWQDERRLTSREFTAWGMPHHIVVEAQEYDDYSAVIDPSIVTLLILDPAYQKEYNTFNALGADKGTGSGPARNFAWQHAIDSGARWHWCVDDNIRDFYRMNRNKRLRFKDGSPFRAMEDFIDRYENVSMAGPNYVMFAKDRDPVPPFNPNTRIYSCNLIRNDVPFRWRGRYNEDTDLSLRMLKAGWCTVLFNAFLQQKVGTQSIRGGNTDTIYVDGTLEKSRMIVDMHPDVARLTWKFNRWHHHVDYRRFKRNQLKLKPGIDLSTMEPNEYGMKLVNVKTREPIPTPALHKAAD